jgi:hypothetical protein
VFRKVKVEKHQSFLFIYSNFFFVYVGCLEAAMDIRSILRNTLKDQLTLFPDYKTAVIGYVFKYLADIREGEMKMIDCTTVVIPLALELAL